MYNVRDGVGDDVFMKKWVLLHDFTLLQECLKKKLSPNMQNNVANVLKTPHIMDKYAQLIHTCYLI